MPTTSLDCIPSRFREVMAGVCTPVSVVTTTDGKRPHGTTVSAFASLSIDPAMILVSLDKRSELLRLIELHRRFGVNVLSSGQSALAVQFATKGHNKFHDVPWSLEDGAPRIEGASGWVACATTILVPGGDHVVVLGEVLAAEGPLDDPLTYYMRTFGTHRETRGALQS